MSTNRWIKSSRPVRFPIQSFRPSKYLAQRSSTNLPLRFQSIDDSSSSSSSSALSLTTTTVDAVSSSSNDNMLVLSPSRLLNGNINHMKVNNEPNTGLPPPERMNSSKKKKKKRPFSRRHKHSDIDKTENNLCPPRFNQMGERTPSLGGNSFDVDNATYDLYAFIVRINL